MVKKYKFSVLLRPFRSFIFLAPLLLDGNLQYFSFVMFSHFSMGFSLNRRDKIMNVVSIMIYFFIILFSVVSCFLSYYLNRKLTKYILDNWRTRVFGLLSYNITNAIRMLVFGAIHSLLRSSDLQLPMLMGGELLYILFFILSIKYWDNYNVSFKIWFTVWFSSQRFLLQMVLFLQQSLGIVNSDPVLESMFNKVIRIITILYMVTFYMATLWELVFEVT